LFIAIGFLRPNHLDYFIFVVKIYLDTRYYNFFRYSIFCFKN